MGRLGRLRGERLIVERLGRHRVQGQRELVPPAELEPRLGQGIVAFMRPGVALGEVGGMGRDLVGDQPVFTSSLLGSPRCSLGVT